MFNSDSYSLADIAAATGRGNGYNSGFGFDGGWWGILLFLFAIGAFGGGFGGFGGYGNRGWQGTTTREEVAYGFDVNGIENTLNGIQSSLSDNVCMLNTSILNAHADTQGTLAQGFSGLATQIARVDSDLSNALNTTVINGMQNTAAITSQLTALANQANVNAFTTNRAIEQGFCDLNYNITTQENQTRQAIVDNTKSILDFLTQDKIATLTAENQALKFAASQQAQNAYLVSELAPKLPVAAYTVPNPYTGCCGGGCGCSGAIA